MFDHVQKIVVFPDFAHKVDTNTIFGTFGRFTDIQLFHGTICYTFAITGFCFNNNKFIADVNGVTYVPWLIKAKTEIDGDTLTTLARNQCAALVVDHQRGTELKWHGFFVLLLVNGIQHLTKLALYPWCDQEVTLGTVLIGFAAQALQLDFKKFQTTVNVFAGTYLHTLTPALVMFEITSKIVVVVTG